MSEFAKPGQDQRENQTKAVLDDASEQIAALRAQVQTLMSERATPALQGAADQGQDHVGSANKVTDSTREHSSFDRVPSYVEDAVEDAIEDLLSDFDVRLAAVSRDLDRILAQRG